MRGGAFVVAGEPAVGGRPAERPLDVPRRLRLADPIAQPSWRVFVTPFLSHPRKNSYTVRQGGKSAGSARQMQPLYAK